MKFYTLRFGRYFLRKSDRYEDTADLYMSFSVLKAYQFKTIKAAQSEQKKVGGELYTVTVNEERTLNHQPSNSINDYYGGRNPLD